MTRYKKDPEEFLSEVVKTILTENISELSAGGRFFAEMGVLVTDNIEDEYISPKNPPLVVETPYAQSLSWLLLRLGEPLSEVAMHFDKKEFYAHLAERANEAIEKGCDETGLLLAVAFEALLLTCRMQRIHCTNIKDELLACSGSLSDLAEKI